MTPTSWAVRCLLHANHIPTRAVDVRRRLNLLVIGGGGARAVRKRQESKQDLQFHSPDSYRYAIAACPARIDKQFYQEKCSLKGDHPSNTIFGNTMILTIMTAQNFKPWEQFLDCQVIYYWVWYQTYDIYEGLNINRLSLAKSCRT